MRYVVVGTSGAGKTTFGRELAHATGSPFVELDELHWAENWTERPTAEFAAAVTNAIKPERWVVDGNYAVVRGILWPRATHVIWLNFSRTVVYSRVLRRTLRRTASGQHLWHGNRESLAMAFFSRDSILLWALATYAKNQARYAKLREDPAYGHLTWIEFVKPSLADQFIASQVRSDA